MSTRPSPAPTPDRGLPPEAEAWLAEHPEADPADLEKVWRLAEYAQPPEAAFTPDPDRVEAMRARVRAVTTEADAMHQLSRMTLIRVVPHTWAVAASVVLLIAVGAWLFLKPISLQAPAGERLTATLPDGSMVELNSGARLAYARPFTWGRRAVRLTGEAFFDVASDPQKPFIVQTFNASVTVLGTRFNVRAWPTDPTQETVVVLEEGAVRVDAVGAPGQPALLEPGQMSRVTGDETPPSPPAPASVEQMLSWRQGDFFFDNHPIATILAEIGRRFGVVIDAPETLAERRASLIQSRPESVDTVLDLLCRAFDCRFRATPDGYELLEAGTE